MRQQKLVQGNFHAALLPEPLVTKALFARSGLLAGENVSDVYGKYSGRLTGMPIAGIAVNSRTARQYPEIISWIAKETMTQSKILERSPAKGVDSLPEEFQTFLSREMIRASLQRERVFGAYSHAVHPEIQDYMSIILFPSEHKNKPLPDSLFWK